MSEYIEITVEPSEDGAAIHFFTNLRLADRGEEMYASVPDMEEGSPLAQALAVIPGLARVHIAGENLIVWRAPEVTWHALVEDVAAVLKDFFL